MMRTSFGPKRMLLWFSTFLAGGLMASALHLGTDALAQKASGTPVASHVLVTEEVRLMDKAGKVRARVMPSTGEVGVSVAIYHKDGKHMTVYRLGPEGLPGLDVLPVPKGD
jgi:hypothetical protein